MRSLWPASHVDDVLLLSTVRSFFSAEPNSIAYGSVFTHSGQLFACFGPRFWLFITLPQAAPWVRIGVWDFQGLTRCCDSTEMPTLDLAAGSLAGEHTDGFFEGPQTGSQKECCLRGPSCFVFLEKSLNSFNF